MPAIAGTAGQTSSIRIKGSIDTSDIETGFSRVASSFEGVKGRVKGLSADMTRMALSVSSLVKKFFKLSLIGVGAITALASRAPAVAPALAKMKLAVFKLSNALGTALAPAFERVVGWVESLVTWVGNNQDVIANFANGVLNAAQSIGTTAVGYIQTLIDKLKELKAYRETEGEKGVPEFKIPGKAAIAAGVGAVAGLKGGPLAGVAAGGITYGGLTQFERTAEFQTRLGAGEGGLESAARSFAPGIVGDIYASIFSGVKKIFGKSNNEDERVYAFGSSQFR